MSNFDTIIDVRDLIEQYEALETEVMDLYLEQATNDQSFNEWVATTEGHDELKEIALILDELKGSGGDEEWRGDWYPLILIADSHFVDYCEELVSDIGDMPREIPSYIEIDWEATANNIKVDYSEIDIDGDTYYFR
jgi:hypothetical protein